jgi:hypothetical protein
MRRTIILFLAGVLMVAFAAGAALAVLRVGNDNPNTLHGTTNAKSATAAGSVRTEKLGGGVTAVANIK